MLFSIGFGRFNRNKEKGDTSDKPKETEKEKEDKKPKDETPKEEKEKKPEEKKSVFLIQTGPGSDQKSQFNSEKPPSDNKNYLPFAIIGLIYLLYSVKPKENNDGYMSYKVAFFH